MSIITQDDFKKIWASTSSVPEYTFSDSDYQNGWEFVDELPPTRAMWDTLQRRNDQKMKFLQDNGSMCFDSVADMVATDIDAGQTVLTKGYHSVNDGGSALYTIRAKDVADVDDGGSIIFLDNGNVAELITDGAVNVKQFGAKGDGVTDDSNALTNCFAFSNVVNFGKDMVCIVSDHITVNSNTVVHGNGATIKIKDNTRIDYIFDCTDADNIAFYDLTFDMNMPNMPTYTEDRVTIYNRALYCYESSNITVERCRFINLYNQSIFLYHIDGIVTITNNYFRSLAQNQGYCAEHLLLQTIGETVKINIVNNKVENEAYTDAKYGVCFIVAESCKAQLLIAHNKIINCGRDNTYHHRLYPIDFYGAVQHAKIIGNTMRPLWGICRLSTCSDIVFSNNNVEFDAPVPIEALFVIYKDANRNLDVENISIVNNVFSIKMQIYQMFYLSNTDNVTVPMNNIKISGNRYSAVQDTCFVLTQGRVSNLEIAKNLITKTTGANVCVDSQDDNFTATATVSGLRFIGNNVSGYYRTINLNNINANITITDITVCNNNIENTSATATFSLNKTTKAFFYNNVINKGGLYALADCTIYAYCNQFFDLGSVLPFNATNVIQANNTKDGNVIS